MPARATTAPTAAALRHWLASGEPQSPSGAFYAWVEEDGRPAFEYPEITGYALTHLAGLEAPDDAEVAAGERAGRWLLERLGGGDLSARRGWDDAAVYTFDLAMISTGAQALGHRYGDDALVALGLGLAAGIGDEVAATGALACLPPSSGTSSQRSAWSTQGRAHLLKAVQCLLWADSLGQAGARDAAAALVIATHRDQLDDGRFVTHPPTAGVTLLHPHLYAVEGLWVHARATGDTDSLERARRATQWVWGFQRPSGAFPRSVDAVTGEQGPDQGDLTAQALRAAVLLDVAPDRQELTARWLADVAVPAAGGPEAGVASPYQPGSGAVHRNTWSTLFAAQALSLTTSDDLAWRHLV